MGLCILCPICDKNLVDMLFRLQFAKSTSVLSHAIGQAVSQFQFRRHFLNACPNFREVGNLVEIFERTFWTLALKVIPICVSFFFLKQKHIDLPQLCILNVPLCAACQIYSKCQVGVK